jgi:hypothetical protein
MRPNYHTLFQKMRKYNYICIIRNAGLLLLLVPLISMLVPFLYFSSRCKCDGGSELFVMLLLFLLYAFSSHEGGHELFIIMLFLFSLLGVICNLCGIIFSMIFFRWIKLVFAGAIMFTANMFLSQYLLPPLIKIPNIGYNIIVVNVISLLLSLGIAKFDNMYMKRYFKKILTMDNDVILARINKIKTSNVVFYLNKYKRKEPVLYNSLIVKFEEMKIKQLLGIDGVQ